MNLIGKALAALTLVGYATCYRIAVLNDIHADLTYDPTSALCISKTLPPLNHDEVSTETYTALKS